MAIAALAALSVRLLKLGDESPVSASRRQVGNIAARRHNSFASVKLLGKNPATGEPDAGAKPQLCRYIRGQSGMAVASDFFGAPRGIFRGWIGRSRGLCYRPHLIADRWESFPNRFWGKALRFGLQYCKTTPSHERS
jgi:hypothetical protein